VNGRDRGWRRYKRRIRQIHRQKVKFLKFVKELSLESEPPDDKYLREIKKSKYTDKEVLLSVTDVP